MRVYALCGDEGENTKMTKLCPLQQGLRPCVSECAWYDTLNLCCEVKMITDSLNDIAIDKDWIGLDENLIKLDFSRARGCWDLSTGGAGLIFRLVYVKYPRLSWYWRAVLHPRELFHGVAAVDCRDGPGGEPILPQHLHDAGRRRFFT